MRCISLFFLCFPVLAVFLACNPDGGNMEPMPYECEYETSYYPWSQAEIKGISLGEILAQLEISMTDQIGGNLLASGHGEVGISLSIARREDSVAYRESIDGGCDDLLEMPVTLSLSASNQNESTRGEQDQAETVFSWQFETEAVKNLFSTSGDIRIYQEFGLSDISGSFSPADYTDDGIRGLALEIDITSSGGSLAVVVLTGGSTGNTVWAGKEEAIIFDW